MKLRVVQKNHVLTWIPVKPKSIVTVMDLTFNQSQPEKESIGGTKGGFSGFWTNQVSVQVPSVVPSLEMMKNVAAEEEES